MEFFVIQTLNGLSYGLLLFLLSAGLTLIFSMMGVLNFAHASFYMVGAYFGYQITRWLGFWPGLLVAPLAVGVIGMLVERYGLRQVHKHGHVAELLFTFGLAYLIEEAIHLVWGRAAVEYNPPPALDGPLFTVFGSSFPIYRGFMAAVAIAMLVGDLPRAHAHARGPRDPGRAHAIRARSRRSGTTCRACSCSRSAAARRSPRSPARSADRRS